METFREFELATVTSLKLFLYASYVYPGLPRALLLSFLLGLVTDQHEGHSVICAFTANRREVQVVVDHIADVSAEMCEEGVLPHRPELARLVIVIEPTTIHISIVGEKTQYTRRGFALGHCDQ
jgi:hypothetical protein